VAEFRLLGPVEVWADGQRLDAGEPRRRAVLAALLADAGRSVAVDTLTDRVWGPGDRPNRRAGLPRPRCGTSP
jgi:DNA-binding SARP family transcriptional activator